MIARQKSLHLDTISFEGAGGWGNNNYLYYFCLRKI
jgi:hypothetical protein